MWQILSFREYPNILLCIIQEISMQYSLMYNLELAKYGDLPYMEEILLESKY